MRKESGENLPKIKLGNIVVDSDNSTAVKLTANDPEDVEIGSITVKGANSVGLMITDDFIDE